MTAPTLSIVTDGYPQVDPDPVGSDDQVPDVDPDAPYGRKPDGTPYKMPAEERQSIGDRLRAAKAAKAAAGASRGNRRQTRRSAAPPPRKSGPPSASSGPKVAAPIAKDYRPALNLIMSIPVAFLSTLGRNNKVFALDAVAVALHTPDIVQATQEAAEQDARIAAVLDKLLAVSPYGALLAAFAPLAAQLAHNHGVMPPIAELGVYTADELVAELERRSGTAPATEQ